MLILSFLFISLFIGIIGLLIYFLYKPIRKRLINSGKLTPHRSTQIINGYIILLFFIAVFQTYKTNYPFDSFYYSEFESVTLREPPQSVEIIKKTSSYPDFHGDYCSSSLMKLSKEDYIKLYNDLLSDTQLIKNGTVTNSDVFDKVLDRNKQNQIRFHFRRIIPDKSGLYLFIGFLNDEQTIIVNKCSS